MKYLWFAYFILPLTLLAQTSGNITFGTNQVIEARFTFTQPGFWDSLVANYVTETEMLCASLDITDNTGLHHFDSINIRLKGNSSYGHPGNKKSFKIDFNDYVSGQKYDGLKKLNFNNGFNDPTFMREKIFLDACRAAGIPAPRVNYVNVYFNNTFWGFYSYVEQVDKEFIQNNFIDDRGNLFKAGDAFGANPVFADLKDYGTDPAVYVPNRYELKTNETTNDVTDLIQLIQYINGSTNADFEQQLWQKFNQEALLKSIGTDVLFSNLDSYQNSARNYYIYHDSILNRWEWIKWDGNEAFGSYTGGPGAGNMEQLAINYVGNNRPLISNIFANSGLYILYQRTLCFLLENYFNNTYLDPKIDALKALIETHVAADNLKQFTTAQFSTNINSNITVTGGPMPGGKTYYGLKSFISNRNTFVSSQLDCVTLEMESIEKNKVRIYPNPSHSLLTFEGNSSMEFDILDMQGRSVKSQIILQNYLSEAMVFNVSNLMEGIYFLQIDGSSYSFIKQ